MKLSTEVIEDWFYEHLSRIIFLLLVIGITYVLVRFSTRAIRKTLSKTDVPNVSLFVNIIRIVWWSFALITVMYPVFGIQPTTFATALGIGGVAVSLGLQTTISNIVGGIALTLAKVVQPGDKVTIQGTTGVVKDMNWRHTIISERSGNELWIPNSVMNSTPIQKMPIGNEAWTTLNVLVRTDIDPKDTEEQIIALVTDATHDMTLPDSKPIVRYGEFTAYGLQCQIILLTKQNIVKSVVCDKASRALAGQAFLAH